MSKARPGTGRAPGGSRPRRASAAIPPGRRGRALVCDLFDKTTNTLYDLAGAQRFDNRLERLPSHALTLAVSARIALRNGDWSEARRSLVAGQHILPGLTEALPWLAVQTRLELAGAHVMLRDAAAARLLISAYRKLGASSRGEAVQEAEKLGLIDTAPAMSTSAMTRP